MTGVLLTDLRQQSECYYGIPHQFQWQGWKWHANGHGWRYQYSTITFPACRLCGKQA